jgi:hypothetical protein
MAQAPAITKAILSFRDLQEKFALQHTDNPEFFHEWQAPLPELTDTKTLVLNRLAHRYLSYLEEGEVSEGTLNIILLSSLLDALGLCDPPYRIRGETWVEVQVPIDTEEGKINLEERIDPLTLREDFWLVVIEGKRGGFNVLRALPQAIAYMSATPHPDRPVLGLVSNGYDYLFLKVHHSEFALSDHSSLLSDVDRNLLKVGQILKHLVRLDLTSPVPLT